MCPIRLTKQLLRTVLRSITWPAQMQSELAPTWSQARRLLFFFRNLEKGEIYRSCTCIYYFFFESIWNDSESHCLIVCRRVPSMLSGSLKQIWRSWKSIWGQDLARSLYFIHTAIFTLHNYVLMACTAVLWGKTLVVIQCKMKYSRCNGKKKVLKPVHWLPDGLSSHRFPVDERQALCTEYYTFTVGFQCFSKDLCVKHNFCEGWNVKWHTRSSSWKFPLQHTQSIRVMSKSLRRQGENNNSYRFDLTFVCLSCSQTCLFARLGT